MLRLLLALLCLIVAIPILLCAALNTDAGRRFAAHEIGALTHGQIEVSGIHGLFPIDIEAAKVTVADAKGVYAEAEGIVFRWRPAALVSRTVDITTLSADRIAVSRLPVPAAAPPAGRNAKSGGGFPLPHVELDELAVRDLELAGPVAGTPIALSLSGRAHVADLTHAALALSAATTDGTGHYRLTARVAGGSVGGLVHVDEGAGGLIGKLASLPAGPVQLDAHLAGPLDAAHLDVAAFIAGQHATASGTLALEADHPKADLVFGLPDLPEPARGLVSPATRLTADILRQGDGWRIEDFTLAAPKFTLGATGTVAPHQIALSLAGSGTVEGGPLALCVNATDTDGAISADIAKLSWKSIEAAGHVALAKGQVLPAGALTLDVKRLADLRPFVGKPVSGAVRATFAHEAGGDFTLDAKLAGVGMAGAPGPVDATVKAAGPETALGVTLAGRVANLMGAPATLDAALVLDVPERRVVASRLSAAWKTLAAKLTRPATVDAKGGLAVHDLAVALGGGAIMLDGSISPKLALKASVQHLPLAIANGFVPSLGARGTIDAAAAIGGSASAPVGTVSLKARGLSAAQLAGTGLPAADLGVNLALAGKSARLDATLAAGARANLALRGTVPLAPGGAMDVALSGRTDLRLLDPLLGARGISVKGVITPDITVSGTAKAPQANGTVTLADGSFQDVTAGVALSAISARIAASGRTISIASLDATAGKGRMSGSGRIDLGAADWPLTITLKARNATPIASDLMTAEMDADLTVAGSLHKALTAGGTITIDRAEINIPRSLPPSVAALPIRKPGDKPPPGAGAAMPDIGLGLTLSAPGKIFIRGDGIFAEVGGRLKLGGTAASPVPSGGFKLIRGSIALGGRTLQLTQGTVTFNGDGFIPALDLEASTTSGSTTSTLTIGGTADHPTITLSSTPPLPSDEVLSQLLFGEGTQNLSAFQAASLAAALASLSGLGGGALADPLGGVRSALGLDELSLGGGQNGGAPTVNAGRYVAPGVYVGAQQSTSGSGTRATVEVNLTKRLKLQSATGASQTGSGDSSSIGLTYQFDY